MVRNSPRTLQKSKTCIENSKAIDLSVRVVCLMWWKHEGYNSQKAIKKTNDTKNVETVCQSGG